MSVYVVQIMSALVNMSVNVNVNHRFFFTSNLLTIPAWVKLWLFKPSRGLGKRNPLKHIHVTAISNTDVLSFYLTSFSGHHIKLKKIRKKKRFINLYWWNGVLLEFTNSQMCLLAVLVKMYIKNMHLIVFTTLIKTLRLGIKKNI